MPEGVNLNDAETDDDDTYDINDPHKALSKVKFDDPVKESNATKSEKDRVHHVKESKKKKKKEKGTPEKEKRKKSKKSKESKVPKHGEENLLIETVADPMILCERNSEPPKTLDLSGEKKIKKSKNKKSKSKSHSAESDIPLRKRDDYEETLGIETPSDLPLETPSTPAITIEQQTLLSMRPLS